MKTATKEEWIGYLAGLEKLSLQHADELKKRIDEGKSDRQIEQAGAAVLDCAQRIAAANIALAKYG